LRLNKFARFEGIQASAYGQLGDAALRFADTDIGGGNNLSFVGNGKYSSNPKPDFEACNAGVFVIGCGGVTTNVQVASSKMFNMNLGIALRSLSPGSAVVGNSAEYYRGILENHIVIDNPVTSGFWPVAGVSVQDWSTADSKLEVYQNNVYLNLASNLNPGACGINVLGKLETNDAGAFQFDINRNSVVVDQGNFGIYVSQQKEVWVHDNSETAWPGAGIFVNTNNGRGIQITSANGNLAACNDIHLSAQNTTGLSVVSHVDGRFARNHIIGGQVGVSFSLNCGTATKFACNIMENNSQYGLHYATSNTQTGPQGSGSPNFVTHGNQWISSPAIGAYSANPAVPTHSRYHVKNNASENPIADPAPFWFFNAIPSNIAPTCYFDCPLPAAQFPFAPEITELDEAITRDTIVDSFGLNRWWNRYNLYQKLVFTPSLIGSNTVLSSFRDSMAAAPVGSLVAVLEAIEHLEYLAPNQQALLNIYTAESVNLLDQLHHIDSLRSDTSASPSKLVQWQGWTDSLLTALSTLGTAAQDIAEQLSALRQSEVPAILASIEAVSPEHIFEQDLKTVLYFYTRAVLLNQPPDSTQLDSIYDIATTCPSANGPFAYWARALYGHYTGAMLSETDCSAEYRQSGPEGLHSIKLQENQTLAIKFWPNPADDLILLSVEDFSSEDKGRYLLSNALGRLCMEGQLSAGTNRVGVAHLPNGFYTLQVQTEKGGLVSKLFLIARK